MYAIVLINIRRIYGWNVICFRFRFIRSWESISCVWRVLMMCWSMLIICWLLRNMAIIIEIITVRILIERVVS